MGKTIYIELWMTDWTALALIICVIINNVVFYFAKDVKRYLANKWIKKNKKKVGYQTDGKP